MRSSFNIAVSVHCSKCGVVHRSVPQFKALMFASDHINTYHPIARLLSKLAIFEWLLPKMSYSNPIRKDERS